MHKSDIHTDIAVIGHGFAGLAASLFAANRGIRTIRVGGASEIIFSSGLIDLLGVHPINTGILWDNPWHAIAALQQDAPRHPYSRMQPDSIRAAIDEFLSGLQTAGVTYTRHREKNARVITSMGTVKTTYGVPQSMWSGAEEMGKGSPGLIVGIEGLLGFSPRQIAETLKPRWPGLRHTSISFPGGSRSAEVYTEPIARSLSLPENRRRLAEKVHPHVGDAAVLGFPAIFGIQNTDFIIADMEDRLGCRIFEIPTIPPSITGLRVKEALDAHLNDLGARAFYPMKVVGAGYENEAFALRIGGNAAEHTVRANAVILASGRFLGGGLIAERKRVREAIFNLPVYQPGHRKTWHSHKFLDPQGHAINHAGVEIDAQFRPCYQNGLRVATNLFAAGSILAHQDWIRMKCGAGLAIATAYASIKSFLKQSF